MKKFIVGFLLLCGIYAGAQEADGVFVGADIGFSELQMKEEFSYFSYTYKESSFDIGVKAGYKMFFNDWLGLRIYGNVDYTFEHSNLSSLVIAANADALFNFYDVDDLSFGAFAGIGLGANIAFFNYYFDSLTTAGFYADVKLGLRTAIGHHGVDLTATIPFIDTKKSDAFGWSGYDLKFKKNYAILIGYSYTF